MAKQCHSAVIISSRAVASNREIVAGVVGLLLLLLAVACIGWRLVGGKKQKKEGGAQASDATVGLFETCVSCKENRIFALRNSLMSGFLEVKLECFSGVWRRDARPY